MFYNDYYFYPRMPMYPVMPNDMQNVPEASPYISQQPSTTPAAPTPEPITTLPPDFEYEPGAPVETDVNYTQGYLKTQIGRYVKIEFLIGTNMLVDREGTLVDVGISYVIIREAETDDLLLCDIYSIKFVRFYY
jgi:hypothetical protein